MSGVRGAQPDWAKAAVYYF